MCLRAELTPIEKRHQALKALSARDGAVELELAQRSAGVAREIKALSSTSVEKVR